MQKQIKVNLTVDNLASFFAINYCCDIKQMTLMHEFRENDEVVCSECEEPIMLRGSNGLWYHVKGRVFE